MGYHVHAHFIVPGGGISTDGKRWLPAQRDYLMPESAVAKILRAKFRDALKKTELFSQEAINMDTIIQELSQQELIV